MADAEPRKWSFISAEQLERYETDARRLIGLARAASIPPFAAAIAGVALIDSAVITMGGDLEWWVTFLRTGKFPKPPAIG